MDLLPMIGFWILDKLESCKVFPLLKIGIFTVTEIYRNAHGRATLNAIVCKITVLRLILINIQVIENKSLKNC